VYTIQYCCFYREQWYDDDDGREYADAQEAVNDAMILGMETGRRVRVIAGGQTVVWTT
jgi:hypothetical protein